jgi:protein required for attachment to host cells
MSHFCVVVADGARARFFSLVPARHPSVESGPKLVEQDALVNEDFRLGRAADGVPVKDRSRRASSSSHARAEDTAEMRRRQDIERKFAGKIVAEAGKRAQAMKAKVVVFAADKKMLGLLRKEETALHGLEVREIGMDLTRFEPGPLHKKLADNKLIPPELPPHEVRKFA